MEHTKLTFAGHIGRPNSGVALVLVLLLVVLTTVMILAFFLSVQTETKSVRSVVSGQNSRQLADIAVQSVISQIQQATTQGTRVAWASQPGMIRTYNNSGSATGWYKLYSAANMTVSSPSESLSLIANDVPSDAGVSASSTNYGVFTDINSPVYSSDGTLTYPIVNPSGATSIAAATNTVLGFDIATASTPGYSSTSPTGPANNPAAMPVRWLYVLQNGTLATPISSVNGVVSFDQSDPTKAPTASNPIMGRIAYWADDETCKLNVNTAANGTYFDTPRFQGAYGLQNAGLMALTGAQRDAQRLVDTQLSISPPIANEYQRYVGHPAQTRLSYAFPGSPATAIGAQDLGTLSQIFTQVSPFMQWGGSEAGAYAYTDTVPPLAIPQRQTPYATLDEWMFKTQLNASTPATRVLNTDLNTTPNPIVTNTSLQQLRFFLSANSEGPEVNLFGQPRIAIWPINNDFNPVTKPASPYVTTTDKVIARAATLFPTSGGTTTAYPYYFSRSQSASNTYDYSSIPRNISIYKYLQTLAGKAIPGYGGVFTTKYGAPEMFQILTEIFDYIRCTDPSDTLLLGGGSGTATDYQYVQGVGRYVHGQNGTVTAGGAAEYAGAGQVMPIVIQPAGAAYSTKGFGRFYGISEISIDFTRSQAPTDTDSNPAKPTEIVTGVIYLNLYCPSLGPPDLIPNMRIEIDGLRDAGTGTLTMSTTSGGVTSTKTPIFGPVNSAAPQTGDPSRTVFSLVNQVLGTLYASDGWNNGGWYDFIWGGSVGPRQLTLNKLAAYQAVGGSASTAAMPTPTANQGTYMFSGLPMKIPQGSTINFTGGPLKVIISQADYNQPTKDPSYWSPGDGYPAPSSSDIVQTINVTLPAFSVPAPTNPFQWVNPYDSTQTNSWDLSNARLYGSNYAPGNFGSTSPILNGDSVRSLISGYNGDSRLLAAQSSVTGTSTSTTALGVTSDTMTQPFVFLPPTTLTTQTMHTQREIFANTSFQMDGFTSPGSLLSAVSYGSSPSVNGYIGDHTSTGSTAKSPDANGDWENGIGIFPDGPYINKSDEAAYQYAYWGGGTSTVPPPHPYYTGGDSGLATALTYISPNRAVASPVVFGSLSTGVPIPSASPAVPPVPWRTLLFRPQPTHFGATTPEDELLLDWFWMPVAEPYAISTTFATAGKVNMNYQIAPFTYITRATALMGVLGSEYVITVPTSAGTTYKAPNGNTNPTVPYRQPVRLVGSDGRTIDYATGTLGQFNQRFNNGQIFKSAAEICDINLVPNPTPTAAVGAFDPTSASAVATYWTTNALTGDNSRERPYNGLYPRLTTKSNTYTIHVRAQTLKSPSSLTPGQWVENPQLITSEYRGAVTINRYLDPQDPNMPTPAIPDFVNSANILTYSMDSYYKYRVLETRRFLP